MVKFLSSKSYIKFSRGFFESGGSEIKTVSMTKSQTTKFTKQTKLYPNEDYHLRGFYVNITKNLGHSIYFCSRF